MTARFEFATATRIIFGAGSLREVGGLAKELGTRALVVTGRDAQRAAPLLAWLKEKGVGSETFATNGEPDIETVQRGVAAAREQHCDLVIGFGGGSAIDAGKAIAALLANPGDIFDYLEIVGRGRALEKAPTAFMAIPTTAGTGAEVTRNSVLASPAHRVKVSLRSPLMLPRVALVDPELTHDLPPALTASTGLDALTQLIEPYVCARANPMTDALCVEGLPRVAKSLRVAYSSGRDASAREDMAVASLFGGLALANAGLGAVHGLAGPIGGMFPAPHGAVCAALLPVVMAANLRALREREPDHPALGRYDGVAQLLTGEKSATADDGVAWVRKLVADLRIAGLAHYGMKAADHSEVAARALKASSMKANPLALTPDELVQILEKAA